jgi:probable biosynthetic protein (TIGR04099 family)
MPPSAFSIEDGNFRKAEENSILRVSSSLVRVSRTQIQSRHRLAIDGFAIGNVTMVSAFVRRTHADRNHAVARVTVDGLSSEARALAPSSLARLAAEYRAGRVGTHMGFDLGHEKEMDSVAFDPCPGLDFNGAGFLYFANFIAMIDRTEWRLDRDAAISATTVDRDVFF